MTCPHCQETLVLINRQGVDIDYCPACKGVWLDRGELDKIIARSDENSSPSSFNMFDEEEGKHYPQGGQYNTPVYRPKKKKGFLFDFFNFD